MVQNRDGLLVGTPLYREGTASVESTVRVGAAMGVGSQATPKVDHSHPWGMIEREGVREAYQGSGGSTDEARARAGGGRGRHRRLVGAAVGEVLQCRCGCHDTACIRCAASRCKTVKGRSHTAEERTSMHMHSHRPQATSLQSWFGAASTCVGCVLHGVAKDGRFSHGRPQPKLLGTSTTDRSQSARNC